MNNNLERRKEDVPFFKELASLSGLALYTCLTKKLGIKYRTKISNSLGQLNPYKTIIIFMEIIGSDVGLPKDH